MTTGFLQSGRFAAAFNPLTQVAAIHAMWASDEVWIPGQTDGIGASSWRNQSGGGDPAQATSTAQPIFRIVVSQLGNKPALEFDGVDDCLLVDITDVAQPFKIVAVIRFIATTTGKQAIGIGSGTAYGFGIAAGPLWYTQAGTTISGGTPDASGHVLRATFNGASSQFWLDESSIASGDTSTAALTWLKIGTGGLSGANSRFGNCHVAFYGVYTGATSDASLTTLCNDLKTYYGL